MIIQSHGFSCVSLVAKPLGGEVTVVLDPFDKRTGVRPTSLTADLVFASGNNEAHGAVESIGGEPFVVSMPGEYEVKGITIDARVAPTKADPKHMIARVAVEGMMVGFLGALDRELTDTELELLEGADILILPVGGVDVLTPKQAVEVIQQIEPRMVVPVHTSVEGSEKKYGTVGAFLKELGAKATEETAKLKVAASGLPQDDMSVVVLTRS